jgi:L-ascorbate metabolism protein UlaG (beta-lactamase superfamily)
VKLTLIRSATLRVEIAGASLLVDPQLDPAGARDAVPNTPKPRPTPLVDLPEPAEAVLAGADAVLVTHLHRDHFDETARALLEHSLPLFCPAAGRRAPACRRLRRRPPRARRRDRRRPADSAHRRPPRDRRDRRAV